MQLVDELSMIYTTCLMAWGKLPPTPQAQSLAPLSENGIAN